MLKYGATNIQVPTCDDLVKTLKLMAHSSEDPGSGKSPNADIFGQEIIDAENPRLPAWLPAYAADSLFSRTSPLSSDTRSGFMHRTVCGGHLRRSVSACRRFSRVRLFLATTH